MQAVFGFVEDEQRCRRGAEESGGKAEVAQRAVGELGCAKKALDTGKFQFQPKGTTAVLENVQTTTGEDRADRLLQRRVVPVLANGLEGGGEIHTVVGEDKRTDLP